jgi:alpha-L-fucosidase
MKMRNILTASFLALLVQSLAFSQTDTLLQKAINDRAIRLEWWREARFGMFIHWGPVSLVGTEISWSRGGLRRGIEKTGTGQIPVDVYDNLYKRFDPEKFNATEWVSIAKAAGMKYMVLTAKHCDGFCLWHTKVDSYNIGSTPFKRDVCGELAAAAHLAGMRIGWYYSPMDWRDPDCRTDRNAAYVKRMQTHLSELLGNYGRIDLLWFDTEGGPAVWDQAHTYHIVRALQPEIIINNRLDIPGSGLNDVKTDIGPNADYATPEQQVGMFNDSIPWETCMTIGTQWSWKPNDSLKTAAECIGILVQCITGDGNLLLDVGPMPDGRIEPRQVKILDEIGAWLNKYGESIYDTRGGPFRNGDWGGAAYRDSVVYLHIQKWDGNRLALPPLDAKIVSSSVLTGGNAAVVQSADNTMITMPVGEHDSVDTIVRIVLNRPASTLGDLGPAQGKIHMEKE